MEHLRVWVKELNFFWNNTWHKELNFLWNEIWPKELNFLFYITQRIEHIKEFFRYDLFFFFFEEIQRIEPFFLILRKELNPFSRIWLKEVNSSYKTQRLENFFFNMTQRLQPFEHDSMNWASFLHDSKNWTFSGIWLNGLNTFVRAQVTQSTEPFLECVSNNWAFFFFFECVSQNWAFFFFFFERDSKNWTLKKSATQRNEPF